MRSFAARAIIGGKKSVVIKPATRKRNVRLFINIFSVCRTEVYTDYASDNILPVTCTLGFLIVITFIAINTTFLRERQVIK